MRKNRSTLLRALFLVLFLGAVAAVMAVTIFVKEEVRTSRYQARYLSEISKQLSFKLEPGPSESIRYPEYGPYDHRLGYTLLPDEISRL
ncbi:MAG: hypothetical protein ACU83O_13905, partial [Gammaproteobacteria bacterium]